MRLLFFGSTNFAAAAITAVWRLLGESFRFSVDNALPWRISLIAIGVSGAIAGGAVMRASARLLFTIHLALGADLTLVALNDGAPVAVVFVPADSLMMEPCAVLSFVLMAGVLMAGYYRVARQCAASA